MSESEQKSKIIRHCSMPQVPPRTFSPEVNPNRASLIRKIESKWVNGTNITYGFLEKTNDNELNVVQTIQRTPTLF